MSNVSISPNNRKWIKIKAVSAAKFGKLKLLDQLREALRSRHYSRVEKLYTIW